VTGWSLIRSKEACFLVVDGARGRDYDRIAGPVFSPDNRHVGYIAWRGGNCFAVVDGVESPLETDFKVPPWFHGWVSADGTVLRVLSDSPPEFILHEIRLVPE